MNTLTIFFLIFLVAAVSSSTEARGHHHQLRPSQESHHPNDDLDCTSWRWAIETDDIRNWKVVPKECELYVGHYMLGKHYRKDCDAVAVEAYKYARSVKLRGDGKDIWVFDIDETTLSNLPYYARSSVGFGGVPYNSTAFNAWVAEGKALSVPGTYAVYKELLKCGYKIVFLTGRHEQLRSITTSNLKRAGYNTWDKLILRGAADEGKSAVEYKSEKRTELVNGGGYRIIGNIGDQWSDILGPNQGNRTFKVPDPMYYIA